MLLLIFSASTVLTILSIFLELTAQLKTFLILTSVSDISRNFYRANYASTVLAVIVCLSVCLSVRPAVCLSQVGVVQRRRNLASHQERRTITQGL